jgi:hypothetical protein
MSERVPDALAQVEILDNDGRPRVMSELWHERPAVIHFVRHFG